MMDKIRKVRSRMNTTFLPALDDGVGFLGALVELETLDVDGRDGFLLRLLEYLLVLFPDLHLQVGLLVRLNSVHVVDLGKKRTATK